jgi:hypothetical protein
MVRPPVLYTGNLRSSRSGDTNKKSGLLIRLYLFIVVMKKKVLIVLIIILILEFLTSCAKSRYDYFYRETTNPQYVVDSLLGPQTPYKQWVNFSTQGFYKGRRDLVSITTYMNHLRKPKDTLIITSVTEWSCTDTVLVKKKFIIEK